ncbi:nuclear transport factor 2 family protein [Streptomyces sp. NPDC017993]|uniref:nuclear transport factor 2 family protein n=1 Tax=Streptomyces sp. NPDC017993 TaxID=3365027 RepID=UPI00378F73E2
MALRAYLASMDSHDPKQALDLLEPDFRFLIALPGKEATGQSKGDFAAYIAGRQAVDRVHEILRYSRDGDVETVYGAVTDGGRYVGSFLSAAVISPAGLLARYQSFFTTSFELVDRVDHGDETAVPSRQAPTDRSRT